MSKFNTTLAAAILTMAGFNYEAKAQQGYPQFPIYVSPMQISGFNPFTGGVHTQGTTVHNTAFDPFRQLSAAIPGNVRPVNRPLAGGGWETGTEWYNPATGQWHGNTTQTRPNGLGGLNQQQVIRFAPNGNRLPNNVRPR